MLHGVVHASRTVHAPRRLLSTLGGCRSVLGVGSRWYTTGCTESVHCWSSLYHGVGARWVHAVPRCTASVVQGVPTLYHGVRRRLSMEYHGVPRCTVGGAKE